MSKTNKNKKKQTGGVLFSFLIVAVAGAVFLYHNLKISFELNDNYLPVIAALVIGFIFFIDLRMGLIIATIIGLVIKNIPNSYQAPSAVYAYETSNNTSFGTH